ncbi:MULTISPECIES: bifunctional 3-(3-hydroxy-phenyl)propionate/3-hydroxycinnamic acid hydroxylase MhpA [Glycomyces]|uniref:3-(3-hydroxy-phenyl)propionate hydroxylase n=2 Tax=Glycomyces TaxID=58113 RepID=A0A9X3SYA8_9ACTN|nr:bifunctional 3-(3-hydroxy-phenyl)propionate/3-hydroxycinnamic acid hydroxylase [Glycomyces lechevalierae]MDA1386056.1 bifunctional 3-(3-hydroxy-phenyl)propionate/3-hydroxycinnamic acid hydroxylase [Glycomyces lechevalierae]MDR7340786.1 3-(3-hydroxy-phenyl)propionate hydroxylase [Glycomyces lechevalierae]
MTEFRYVPAVVVGAGPTGVSAAIGLAQRGIECLVLDRWPEVYPLPRAVHFDDEVFRALADLGVGDRVREISRPAPGMQLVDAKLRRLAEFPRDRRSIGYPQANMFDQPDLEQVLRERLAELPEATFRGGVEVTGVEQVAGGPAPTRVRFREVDSGRESTVWADAVLGCDGANSLTRERLGIAMQDLGFEQRWLVVDVQGSELPDVYDGVQQVCDSGRAATFMMITPGRYRWEFRLRRAEHPDEMTDAQIMDLIRPWLGAVDPQGLQIVRRTSYTFRGAVAEQWRDGRIFLLGDAAHLTPPFIGQGMCAGIRDAANLVWKLALVLTGRADDRLLATYETERLPYARRLIRLAILIGSVMTGGTALTSGLRRAAIRAGSGLPGSEQRVVDLAWPIFRAGPLTAPDDRLAGRPCPQPRVATARGEMPLDEALGDGFAIVTRDRSGVFDAFEPAVRDYFAALGTTTLHLGDPDMGGVVDLDGALTSLLDRAGADAVLVRPDRVIAASSCRADIRAWRRMLENAGIRASNAEVHQDRCMYQEASPSWSATMHDQTGRLPASR